MILLDTHIWIWLADKSSRLSAKQLQHIQNHSAELAISAISCWEVAKLASSGRLSVTLPLADWLELAITSSNMTILNLTPEVAVEANFLPGAFHRDPADQIIVATARILSIPLLTADAKILNYPHVQLLT